MTSSQTAEITIISTVAGGERDRGEHGDGGVGVDPGSADEVAVGAALVPRDRLADEPVDDLPTERRTRRGTGSCSANTRRTTTPTERMTPTTNTNAIPAATVADSTSPSSKRGTKMWSITHRRATLDSTVHVAKTAAPPTAMANTRGCSRHHRPDHPKSPPQARPIGSPCGRRYRGIGSIGRLVYASTHRRCLPADRYSAAEPHG